MKCFIGSFHGAVIIGVHGGFCGRIHAPNGSIFTIGFISDIVAIACSFRYTCFIGNTFKFDGAAPTDFNDIDVFLGDEILKNQVLKQIENNLEFVQSNELSL